MLRRPYENIVPVGAHSRLILHIIDCIDDRRPKTAAFQRSHSDDRSASRRADRVFHRAGVLPGLQMQLACADKHLSRKAICLRPCQPVFDTGISQCFDKHCRVSGRTAAYAAMFIEALGDAGASINIAA